MRVVVPLTIFWGEFLCKFWGYDSRPYTISPSRNISCMGIADADRYQVRAIALLERVDRRVIVWDISCGDYESGTDLVGALMRQPPPHSDYEIVFGHTLHPRWRIARAFHLDPTNYANDGTADDDDDVQTEKI